MSKEDPERAQKLASEIIKNTYRTLMTRGMRGCYVHATDPALREYLKRRATDVGRDEEVARRSCAVCQPLQVTAAIAKHRGIDSGKPSLPQKE